jgi:cellulose biosynthesis protein BcsQ
LVAQSQDASKLLSEKEARKEIENLKLKQNHEMLLALEEEQERENKREQKLKSITDAQEKKRYDKICAVERARAHSRIQEMTE